MAQFWIDVYEPGGGPDNPSARVGSGPILTALQWSSTSRLDAAGEIAFSMPATDPKAELVLPRRVVWCYTYTNDGTLITVGAGIVDKTETRVGDPTLMMVTGRDLLAELADRTVKKLKILAQDWTGLDGGHGMVRFIGPGTPEGGDEDLTEAYDGNTGTSTDDITVTDYGAADALYIGYDAPFDSIDFDLNTVNSTYTATLLVQYYSRANGWQALTVTDTTADTGKPFAQDGRISFTRPTDWARCSPSYESDESWFWVRISRVTAVGNNITFSINEIKVYADLPTTDGVNLIMAHAPTAWQGVYPQTIDEHYLEFDGESVLSALVTLAEQGGQEAAA